MLQTKTLRKTAILLIVILVLIILFFGLSEVVKYGERNRCHAWRNDPSLWVEWRIEQCENLGVPLSVPLRR